MQWFTAQLKTYDPNRGSSGSCRGGGGSSMQNSSLDRQGTIHETSEQQRKVKEIDWQVRYVLIGHRKILKSI